MKTYYLSGKRLRAARDSLSRMIGVPVTQREIAAECGLEVGNYCRYEKAIRSNPTVQILAAMAGALRVPMDSLIGEDQQS
jgi:transcriptional regulator with XRE-family HTH domain